MDDPKRWMIQKAGWSKKMDDLIRWMVQQAGWSKKMDDLIKREGTYDLNLERLGCTRSSCENGNACGCS
jgi:hypothetical protein